ncbi:MAG TPA: hypothetical protein VE545_09450 [Candidatus Dormibacteraeota bacterium]|nr:hypothetical protein [Candidatus Dormibacteraeota bacterium]
MDAKPQVAKASEVGKTQDLQLFGSVECSADLGPGRARTIAVWMGLVACAILVSQFGRPSRAREAEFMRGAAKVAALGKVPNAGGAAGENAAASKKVSARFVDEKTLEPAVYSSRKYGVAWQYPRHFVLRKGANAGLDLDGHYAAATAFAGDNGVALASVIIPGRIYPGTDFLKASLTARVNKKVAEEACGRFRILDEGAEQPQDFPAAQVTVGTIDFASAEAVIDGDLEDSATTREKFFHVYENGGCYEFAMSVTTGAGGEKKDLAHVDADQVFERLQEILTSVTIVPVRSGEPPPPAVSAAPLATSTERHK